MKPGSGGSTISSSPMLLHCYCADVLLSPASALLNSGRLHRTSNFWLQPSSGTRRSTSAHRHDCLPGPMIYNQPTRNVRPRIPTGVESSATYIVARRRRQGWAIRDRSAVEGSPIPAAALAYIPMGLFAQLCIHNTTCVPTSRLLRCRKCHSRAIYIWKCGISRNTRPLTHIISFSSHRTGTQQ